MPNTFYKPVSSTISSRQEDSTFQTVNGSGLTFSLCDRTDATNKNGNYFSSFNLPTSYASFASGSTLALSHPELLQINVDKIVIIPIPRDYYNEYIDARSITLLVPQLSGATDMSAKTIVSSTYSTFQSKVDDVILGYNVGFLFSDDINLPYSGRTANASVDHSTNITWNPTNYMNRPAAVPYSDTVIYDLNSDERPFSSVKFAVPVTPSYPTATNQGYNYDVPVGFVCVDKGFMVITHPDIVNNIPWSQGLHAISNTTNVAADTSNIYFTITTKSQASFSDTNVNYETSVVCIGMPGEFYFTNNPSWDVAGNTTELINGTNNFDSVYVTEVGLYNVNHELIAIAKLSEPVEKTFTNLLTFNLTIDV